MPLISPRQFSRRTAIKLTTVSAVLSSCAPVMKKSNKHVAIIGGGIIGASIAYHLAKGGMKVTLLERGELAQRSSRGTFAWINATWAKQPRSYHRFSQAGLSGWKKLQAELDIPIRWEGSLEWFSSPERQARLATQIEEQAAWGEPAKMVGPEELKSLEPNVNFGDIETAALSANDGALDPVWAVQKLAEGAKSFGASIKTNCSVESVKTDSNGQATLKSTCGDLNVDRYVLATGADPEATQSLAGIDIPQPSTPGVIVITKPRARLINRIIVAPGVHIHQREDGRIVLGEQDGAPDTAAHAERLKGRPTAFPSSDFANQHAHRILAIAETFVSGISQTDIEDVIIGWRPLPLDGHPVLGPSPAMPSAYLAIMHSGVTLAPIVGEVVAKEIITGQSAPEIEAYRPSRDFGVVKRY